MMEDSISSTDRSENDYSFLTETPLGDRDKHLKIQLCIEYLTKKKESKGLVNKIHFFFSYSNQILIKQLHTRGMD